MKKYICAILCLMLSCSMLGCSEEKEGIKTKVYYVNSDQNGLVEETYYRRIESGEECIEEVLRALLKPEEEELYSAIPKSVEIVEQRLENGTLLLRFNDAYTQMTASREVLLRAAVVQSLTQLPEVRYVCFYIGEDELVDSLGNTVGSMNADHFVQKTGTALKTYQSANLKLYYASSDGTKLRAENQNNVHYSIDTSVEKLVVEALMKKGALPSTVQLLGVSIRDGICYVNFNSAFMTENHDQTPEITVYSIVNSVIANGTVTQVQILVDGVVPATYKDMVDISKPLMWKAGLIEE